MANAMQGTQTVPLYIQIQKLPTIKDTNGINLHYK